jgi:hypothetical protein
MDRSGNNAHPDQDLDHHGATSSEEARTATELYGSEVAYPPIPTEEDLEAYRGRRALRTPPRADVNLDVPYLHQLWDTVPPPEFDGHWACGPSCVAMVLAYYALLAPRPIELAKPHPHTSDYGWYISNAFTRGGKTFDARSNTRIGSAAGLYGAVVDRIGSGWGAHWRSERDRGIRPLMDVFLPPMGNRVTFLGEPKRNGSRYLQRQPAEAAMKACLDAGHPLIVSGFFQDKFDHLIVVRGYYAEPSSGGELKWIVNDPYGFETTGKGFDGDNVVYEFDEIKPKWMAVFGGSFTPRKAANPDHIAVRLFDPNTNEQLGEGTLIRGTDKVYIKKLDR